MPSNIDKFVASDVEQVSGPGSPIPSFWDAPLQSSGDKYKLDPPTKLSPWDTVVLGGVVAPGLALVQCRKGKRFDIKLAKGAKVPTMTFIGYELAEIVVTIRIWTQAQLADLWRMAPSLNPPAAPPSGLDPKNWPPPIDIGHPSLQMLGITSVHVQHVGALEPTSVKGVWQMRITCTEFQKPDPTEDVTATPKGSLNVNVKTAIKADPSKQFASSAADSKTPAPK